MNQPKLSWKPDPIKDPWESADHLFSPHRFAMLSMGDHIIPEYTPISDQGQVGSCVANGCCDALEMVLGLEDPGAVIQLSRLHLYWIARSYDKTKTLDDGTYVRTAMRQMNRIGVCAEDIWPYVSVEKNIFVAPPLESTIRASENKIDGYYRIDDYGQDRLDAIATAVRANHPVVFGTQVGREWMDSDGSTVLTPPSKSLGGHCTIITGVQQVAGRFQFLDRNSWGTSWGNNGHAWLDEDYMTWGETNDLWVFTRAQPVT